MLRGLAERLGFDPDWIDDVSYPQREYNTIAGATVMKEDGSGYEPLVTITADDVKAMGVKGKGTTRTHQPGGIEGEGRLQGKPQAG